VYMIEVNNSCAYTRIKIK